MQSAARIGYSRLLSRYAVSANSLSAADQAIRLTPDDPDAHRARASVLNRSQPNPRAAERRWKRPQLCVRATRVCGSHWATREKILAIATVRSSHSTKQCVRRLITVNHTGNAEIFCYGMGRYDEAIADLRSAAASDRRFLPTLSIWRGDSAGGDANHTEDLLALGSDRDRLEFARFLARKGQGTAMSLVQLGLLTLRFHLRIKKNWNAGWSPQDSFATHFDVWKGSANFGRFRERQL